MSAIASNTRPTPFYGRWLNWINGRVRRRLMLSFGAVLSLLVVLSFIALSSTRSQLDRIAALVSTDARVAELNLEVANGINNARRLEQEFMLNYQSLGVDNARTTYIEPWSAEIQAVRDNIIRIQQLQELQANESAEAVAQRSELLAAVDDYQAEFTTALATIDERGSSESGVIATMNGEISGVIDLFAEFFNNPELDATLAQLRIYEQDFIRTGDEQILDQHASALEAASLAITQFTSNSADALTDLQNYSAALNTLHELNIRLDKELATATDSIESAATLAEATLNVAIQAQQEQQAQLQRQVTRTTSLIAVISLLVIVGGVLLGVSFSNSISAQSQALLRLFENVNAGEFGARSAVVTQDELGGVAVAVNNLLDHIGGRIESRDEQQQLETAILRLSDEVEPIASGDLSVEAVVTTDMTGAIADSVNFMVEQLREVIGQVQEAALQAGSSSAQIQTTAEHLAHGTVAQAEQIVGTTAAIDEMSVSIQQVSRSARRSASISDQALQNAQQGVSAVEDTVDGIVEIQNDISRASTRIKRLLHSAQEMGDVVRQIEDLTERTSILALNASIQASTAGQAGSQFKRVSSEVEELARGSIDATQQITQLVHSIQDEAGLAHLAIMETSSEIRDGLRLANNAGEHLLEIEAVTSHLRELITAISRSAQQQARGSETVARSMNDIAEITQQTAAGTKQATVSIDNLARLADALRASVSSFKLEREAA